MERERDHDEPIVDGTGLERSDDSPAMRSGTDMGEDAPGEASGDERTAVEGLSGIAATQRAWGGGSVNRAGGIGTHVPTDEDEHATASDEATPGEGDGTESTDPRGY